MVGMTGLDLDLPRGRRWTALEVAEELWVGNRRVELLDGVLVEMPGPREEHQEVVIHLSVLLFQHRPQDLKVLSAPYDVLADDTGVQPDVVVVPLKSREVHSRLGDNYLAQVPLLVVEVLSPSSALYDLNTKFARYERAGVASYWVIDPIELVLTVWELQDGHYMQVAEVTRDESWTATQPFEVTVTPSALRY